MISFRFCWLFARVAYKFLTLFNVRRCQTVLLFYSQSSNKFRNLDIIKEELLKRSGVTVAACSGNDNPLKVIFLLSISRVILIDQSNSYLSNINLSADTVVIQCWHGGGYLKKIAFDDIKNQNPRDYKRLMRIHRNIDYYIISDIRFVDAFAKAFNVSASKILPFGIPRTDKFYARSPSQKVSRQKKVVLYAPTFRELGGSRCGPEIQPVPSQLLDKYKFLYRPHPSLSIKHLPDGWLDGSEYKPEDLLEQIDILISDYSSIIFDFSFFRRPIILFIPDLYDYTSRERGLYIHLDSITNKTQIFTEWDSLYKCLSNGNFIPSDLWDKFMLSCDGKSTTRVVDFIENQISGSS